MQRRSFITTALAATALGSSPTVAMAPKSTLEMPGRSFIVKAGEARFGKHTPFRGVHPNDLKVSSKDTNGMLSMFEYVGNDKVGPSLQVCSFNIHVPRNILLVGFFQAKQGLDRLREHGGYFQSQHRRGNVPARFN